MISLIETRMKKTTIKVIKSIWATPFHRGVANHPLRASFYCQFIVSYFVGFLAAYFAKTILLSNDSRKIDFLLIRARIALGGDLHVN